MSYDMSDAGIERKLATDCHLCAAGSGQECVGTVSGVPLIEVMGLPVHPQRGED